MRASTFANGAVANVTASRVSRERMRKLRIFQRSGYLSLDLAAGTGEFYRMRAISIRRCWPRSLVHWRSSSSVSRSTRRRRSRCGSSSRSFSTRSRGALRSP
jgi:hypothetical protein